MAQMPSESYGAVSHVVDWLGANWLAALALGLNLWDKVPKLLQGPRLRITMLSGVRRGTGGAPNTQVITVTVHNKGNKLVHDYVTVLYIPSDPGIRLNFEELAQTETEYDSSVVPLRGRNYYRLSIRTTSTLHPTMYADLPPFELRYVDYEAPDSITVYWKVVAGDRVFPKRNRLEAIVVEELRGDWQARFKRPWLHRTLRER